MDDAIAAVTLCQYHRCNVYIQPNTPAVWYWLRLPHRLNESFVQWVPGRSLQCAIVLYAHLPFSLHIRISFSFISFLFKAGLIKRCILKLEDVGLVLMQRNDVGLFFVIKLCHVEHTSLGTDIQRSALRRNLHVYFISITSFPLCTRDRIWHQDAADVSASRLSLIHI